MTKEKLINYAVKQLTKMNLTILIAGIDYKGTKPDLVIVYPEKEKYYLCKVIGEDSFSIDQPYLKGSGYDSTSREFYKNYYTDDRTSMWAISIYCDLGQGIELFGYTTLKNIRFDRMQKYASIIYPISLNNEAEKIFNQFNLVYRSINISNTFTLTLFSTLDSIKLAESRRFVQFLSSNKEI